MLDVTQELTAQELLREKEFFHNGRERYLKRLEENNRPSTQNNPQLLINNALPAVARCLREAIEEEQSRPGKPCAWRDDLVDCDPDILAYIGLNAAMDSTITHGKKTSLLTKIGHRVELEVWAQGLKVRDKTLFSRVTKYVEKEHAGLKGRETAARAIASKSNYSVPEWTQDRRAQVGGPILSAVLKGSGIFEAWEKYTKKGTEKRIGLTDEATLALANMDYQASWQEPMLAPMIVAPKPWVSFDTGCYLDEATAAQVPLVRSSNKEQRNAVKHRLKLGMPLYVEALNAIQATPLKINNYVLEAVKWCWGNSEVFGKFPRATPLEFPERPEDFDALTTDEQVLYVKTVREVREKNRELTGASMLMYQDLATATELSQFEQFWLPFNFDFRGRVYPVPHFSYHRDDHIKAMFTLSRGKVMDDDSAFWLYVHLANVGDFNKISKQSLSDRAAWVEDNKAKLYDVGRNSEGTFCYWSTADKPFQFLAACRELANYMDHGPGYVCSLPVSLDGTNSGVQHYSAASLDEADGTLVNLVPGEKPQDVYKTVADVVNKRLLEIADVNYAEPLLTDVKDKKGALVKTAKQVRARRIAMSNCWLSYGVGRSTLKRNVMTYGYSSGQYGFADQIMDEVMRPLSEKVMRKELEHHHFGDEKLAHREHAKFLAKLNYEAVCQVISSASAGMDFFQQIAGALAHEGKSLRFDNPVEFPVIQKYTQWDVKKVKIYLYDRVTQAPKREQVSVRTRASNRVDKKKAKAAVSPNIIHSMDSSHLLLTVLTAKQNGVEDFFLIHDSFGTTPADTDIMYNSVRASFVEIYQDYCLYSDLLNQASKQLSYAGLEKLDVVIPPKGSLDLGAIPNSEYCFS